MIDRLATWGRVLLDLVYPQDCVLCGRATHALCPACESGLADFTRVPGGEALGSVALISATRAHEDALRVLRRVKDQGQTELARPLGRILRAAILYASQNQSGTVLVCVPDSRKSFIKRGFHPVSLIVKRAGFELFPGLESRASALDQRALSAEQRQRNLANTMVAHPDLRSRRVVLIDDVVTTGATATECVRALEKVGAEVVAVVAITVVPRKFPKFAYNA